MEKPSSKIRNDRVGREREERRREEEKLSTYVDLSHVGSGPQTPRHPTHI